MGGILLSSQMCLLHLKWKVLKAMRCHTSPSTLVRRKYFKVPENNLIRSVSGLQTILDAPLTCTGVTFHRIHVTITLRVLHDMG